MVGADLRLKECLALTRLASDEQAAAAAAAGGGHVPPPATSSLRPAWCALLCAVGVLARRLDGGTLLRGCRAEEGAYFACVEASHARARCELPDDAFNARVGRAVGYSAALDAAKSVLVLLPLCARAPQPERAAARAFVLAALGAVPATLGLFDFVLGAEPALVSYFRLGMGGFAGEGDAAFRAAVLAAWTSPAVVSALRSRGALGNGGDEAGAPRGGSERGLLRTCALPGCGAREAAQSDFKRCACRAVAYCCAEHGVRHHRSHKCDCAAR